MDQKVTCQRRVIPPAAALAAVLLSGCEYDAGIASAGRETTMDGEVGQVQTPSCDQVGPPRGIRGKVIGSEWVDRDGITCLEIETKAGGEPRLIRVPRRVFDRCIEGDRYPRCAKRKAS